MLALNWAKLPNGVYCPLRNLDLSSVNVTGVYIIWHGGAKPHAVRLGQGSGQSGVGGRLIQHREDSTIMQYERMGTLLASWAAVPQAYLDGVENYLGQALSPFVGERFPDAAPVVVNLP